ncbi:MAG: hypothetical protein L3J39_14025 [Verrucomicrobiales bacterium]|nr:hypothetical protein [Verrucomicrobiales bacterium]
MEQNSIPPLPRPESSQNPAEQASSNWLGKLALLCAVVAFATLAASSFLLYQQEEATLMAGMILGGVGLLASLTALIMGFVALVSEGRAGRVMGAWGMSGGVVALLAIVVLTVVGVGQKLQQKIDFAGEEFLEYEAEEEQPLEPLVIEKDAKTVADNYQLWVGWLDENLYRPMKWRLKGKAWEKVGKQVVDAFVSDWLSKWDRRTEKEWQDLAGELSRLGCDDPALLYMVSRTCDIGDQQFGVLTWSTKWFGKSKWNPIFAFMAQIEKIKKVDYAKKGKELEALDAEALRRLEKACEQGCFEGENLWLLHQLMNKKSGPSFVKRNAAKIAAVFERTKMPEWTVGWMMGKWEVKLAWDSRGGSYAHKVKEEGWKGFREHLALAREHLTRSWELAPEFPFASAEMIRVSMGSSKDPSQEIRLWLDRSMQAQVDYWPAFEAYIWALRPRWHGSIKMMEQFGEYCLANGDYTTGVPMFYFRVVEELAEEADDVEAFYKQDEIYNNLCKMYEEQAKVCVDDEGSWFCWTKVAMLAYQMEDFDKLSQMWQRMEERPSLRAMGTNWKLDREDFSFCALMDQSDPSIRSARDFRKQGLYGSAIGEYQSYQDKKELDEAQRAVLKKRIALLKVEEKWHAGEWVTLWPTPSPELWQAVEGSWEKTDEGALLAKSEGFRYAIEHALRVGEDYEVEASIGPAKNMPDAGGHGLWVSRWRWYGDHWDAAGFSLGSQGKRFFVTARRWRYHSKWAKKIERKEPHVLNLLCHKNLWQISVDGKKLNDKEIEMEKHHNGKLARLALGGYVDPDKGTTVEYQRVRVRKLEAREDVSKSK